MIDAVRLRVVLAALAGWVNRHQLEVIEYLREENRVLKDRKPLTLEDGGDHFFPWNVKSC